MKTIKKRKEQFEFEIALCEMLDQILIDKK